MHTDTFYAISDSNRRFLLDIILRKGPQRAGDLAGQLPHISRPAVSKHLRILKEAQLVAVTRIGREHWYQLNTAPLAEVHRWVGRYEHFWQRKLESLKEIAEEIEENDLQDQGGGSRIDGRAHRSGAQC